MKIQLPYRSVAFLAAYEDDASRVPDPLKETISPRDAAEISDRDFS
jgi:hypothetical protein